jgi:hypothetical protein
MKSMLAKILLNRWSIVVLDLLIAAPLTLALIEVASLLWGSGLGRNEAIREAAHIIEGMGIILIGWGVVLEERHGVSHLLGGLPTENPEYESAIDALCHHSGLAILILGLIAEILVQCVVLPDHIIYTVGIERVVLTCAELFLGVALVMLLQHVGGLATLREPAPVEAVPSSVGSEAV